MLVRAYPLDDGPNVYVNPQWLSFPVRKPDSIANYYISGSGVADFTDDPPWDGSYLANPFPAKFTLQFARSDIPPDVLGDDDVYILGSGIAAVSVAHIDRDTEGGSSEPWLLGLTTVAVVDTAVLDNGDAKTWWKVEVSGEYAADLWMDKLSYKLGFLVYRPIHAGWVWKGSKIWDTRSLVKQFGDFLHGP